MGKPYIEVHRNSAQLQASVEDVWAHHCDIESQLAAHPRLRTLLLESGRMGEAGCVTSATGVDAKGKFRETRMEVLAATAPHYAIVKSTSPSEPDVHTLFEYRFARTQTGCRIDSTITIETKPVPALTRWIVSWGARGRSRIARNEFELETRETADHLARAR